MITDETAAPRGTGVPTLNEYRDALVAWLADQRTELDPFRARHPFSVEDRNRHLRPLHRLLYSVGWARWGWPEFVGGFGGPVLLRGVLYEELCRAGLRLPDSMLQQEVMAPVVCAVAPEFARTHVPALIAGEETWSQGFSEPEAGSDLGGLRCRAELRNGEYLVNGHKIWASFGHLARRCLLLVRTGTPDSRHRGLSFLLVDHDTPGVTVRPIRTASGRNDVSELHFEDARVSEDRMVGEPGSGWESAMHLLQWERGMYAWQRQASLHTELHEALHSVTELSEATVERIGVAYRQLHSLRLASRRTLRALSDGRNPGPAISVDKILLSRAEQAVHAVMRELSRSNFELGSGADADLLRADFWYARTASIYGGSVEIQRSILADQVLRLPKEGR